MTQQVGRRRGEQPGEWRINQSVGLARWIYAHCLRLAASGAPADNRCASDAPDGFHRSSGASIRPLPANRCPSVAALAGGSSSGALPIGAMSRLAGGWISWARSTSGRRAKSSSPSSQRQPPESQFREENFLEAKLVRRPARGRGPSGQLCTCCRPIGSRCARHHLLWSLASTGDPAGRSGRRLRRGAATCSGRRGKRARPGRIIMLMSLSETPRRPLVARRRRVRRTQQVVVTTRTGKT